MTFFYLVILSLFAQSILLKMRIDDLIPLVLYIDEFILLIFLVYSSTVIRGATKDHPRFLMLFFLLIYTLFSLVVSLFSEVNIVNSLQQYFLDSKYFIVLFGSMYAFSNISVDKFEVVLRFLIVVNIPFIIFQSLMPDYFNLMFPRGGDGIFALMNGILIARFSGAFEFAGILSTIAACGICFYWFSNKEKKCNKNSTMIFLSLLLMTLTVSRAEFTAIVLAMFIYSVLADKKISSKFIYISSLLALLTFSVIFLQDYLYFAFVELGIFRHGYDDLAPRGLFLNTSIQIANDYFPLGSGLGTFGGIVAVNTDSSIFYKYLIAYEWYYPYGLFLTDTYWPKFIAESGFIGALLYFSFVLSTIFYFNRKKTQNKITHAYTVSMLIFLLITSFTSPVYSHLLTLVMCLCLCTATNKENAYE
jgi:hypothetical protein